MARGREIAHSVRAGLRRVFVKLPLKEVPQTILLFETY